MIEIEEKKINRNILKIIKKTILKEAKKMKIKIERIILFGSRAREDYNNNSDYDILVITENGITEEKKGLLLNKLYDSIGDNILKHYDYYKYYNDTDFIIHTQSEAEKLKNEWWAATHNALKEGIVL